MSVTNGRHTGEQEEPGALAALGALALVGALVAAIFLSFANPAAQSRQSQRQAAALLAEGRYSDAVALYERALATNDVPEVRLGLSYGYLALRDGERAERQARSALAAAPPDLKPAAWAQLGRVLAFEGHYDDALKAWATAQRLAEPYKGLQPIDVEARSAMWHTAMYRWAHGNPGAAEVILDQLQEGDDAYAVSARVKQAQMMSPAASDISQKLLADIERDLKAGVAERGVPVPDLRLPGLREGLPADAISSTIAGLRSAYLDVDRARKSGADAAGLDAIWGRAFLLQGETTLARTYLESAVRLQPGLSDAHSYLALVLMNTGDDEGALSHLQTAAKLSPQRPLPHQVLAQLYMARQDWANASQELSTLKKLEPDSVQVHLQLADYYTQRSAYDPAEDEYIAAVEKQRAQQPNPQDVDAALALSRFYTDIRGLGCEKGLPAAKESLARHQGDPASLDAVGWATLQCGKVAEALPSLESAVKSAPEIARFRYHLARAYAELGRAADARGQYNRVIDLDPGGVWARLSRTELVQLGT